MSHHSLHSSSLTVNGRVYPVNHDWPSHGFYGKKTTQSIDSKTSRNNIERSQARRGKPNQNAHPATSKNLRTTSRRTPQYQISDSLPLWLGNPLSTQFTTWTTSNKTRKYLSFIIIYLLCHTNATLIMTSYSSKSFPLKPQHSWLFPIPIGHLGSCSSTTESSSGKWDMEYIPVAAFPHPATPGGV